ncbi:lipase [Microbacterium sp. Root61]|nr:lipase [Microbacterium sp. Root61]
MMSDDLIDIDLAPAFVHGVAELEATPLGLLPHRLPAWARAQNTDPQLAMVEAQPSGVRLAFTTAATTIELVTHRTVRTYLGLPPRPDGVIELIVDGRHVADDATSGGTTIAIDMATGSANTAISASHTTRFDGLAAHAKDVEIWLPHNENLELVSLRANADAAPLPTDGRPVWVHHGSSISHGSNATHPTGTWPAVAARSTGVELVNLGFGGSALLDPFVARVIRDADADVISLKLGINLVNLDLMRLRAFGPAVHGFLDTIREGHPTTPLVVISPIFCGIHENTPGPGAFDVGALAVGQLRFHATGDPAEASAGKLTLTVIREALERIVKDRRETDTNLHYLDGRVLYAETDAADYPLPDELHPDAQTHQFIGSRFAAWMTDCGILAD